MCHAVAVRCQLGWPGLENPLLKWFTHTAARLLLSVGWEPTHEASWVFSSPGSRLPPGRVIQQIRQKLQCLLWPIYRRHTPSLLLYPVTCIGLAPIHCWRGMQKSTNYQESSCGGVLATYLLFFYIFNVATRKSKIIFVTCIGGSHYFSVGQLENQVQTSYSGMSPSLTLTSHHLFFIDHMLTKLENSLLPVPFLVFLSLWVFLTHWYYVCIS